MTDFSKIKAVAFDIDGVMTDGGLLCTPDGEFLRVFDAKDAFAVRMAEMHGIICAVITGGSSESIRKRFVHCGVKYEDVFLSSAVKMHEFGIFCDRYGLKPEDVAYFGDDLPDVPVLKACGLGVAPADACAEAKEAADYVSPFPGGKFCMRDTMEKILKSQGKWNLNDDNYRKYFKSNETDSGK